MSFLRTAFNSPLERRFFGWYYSFFSISEIERSMALQFVLGSLLLSFFVSFNSWFYSAAITVSSYVDNTYRCWPYFQNCGRWYVLETLPNGYSQPIVYMVFFALMLLAVYLMYRKEWGIVHALLMIFWTWSALLLFVLTRDLIANYYYYMMIIGFVVLFFPWKIFFARLTFVLLYFLASTIKFHSGWVLGTYFTSLKTGLPLFGNTLAPIAVNIVIFSQVVGCWFLLSRNVLVRRVAAGFFIFFHLYSGILVGYHYPTTALVLAIILFSVFSFENFDPPFDRRSLPGWVFIAILLMLQISPYLIRGDSKMTLEGNYYGLYMFEANHQCASHATIYWKSGTSSAVSRSSTSARARCDLYVYWFPMKQACLRNPNIERVAWTFDHSINGGPFYRIVDEANVCTLTYRPFSHNTWVRLPEDGASIVGYPVKNEYD